MISELSKICKIVTEEDLTTYNTYRLHSICYCMVFPKSINELTSVFSIIKNYKSKYFVIGNGSNIILPDYYDGVIINMKNFKKCIITNNNVYVESGYMLNKLANKLCSLGYTGLEWATGIPGTIGGSLYGNAGAYNSSMKDVVMSVIVFDGKHINEYTCEEMEYGYRTSRFKNGENTIILSCNLKLEKGNIDTIKELVRDRLKKRIESQPLEYPSCGSVFRNPEGMFVGKMIEDLGLKGYSINDATISKKHANFIINNGNATSKDIITLIKLIRKEVKKTYKVDLITEIEIIK